MGATISRGEIETRGSIAPRKAAMDARHDETSLADLIESQGESIGLGLDADDVRVIVQALRDKYDRRKLFDLCTAHAKVPTRQPLHEDDGA